MPKSLLHIPSVLNMAAGQNPSKPYTSGEHPRNGRTSLGMSWLGCSHLFTPFFGSVMHPHKLIIQLTGRWQLATTLGVLDSLGVPPTAPRRCHGEPGGHS